MFKENNLHIIDVRHSTTGKCTSSISVDIYTDRVVPLVGGDFVNF
jgi:hypothetical protein